MSRRREQYEAWCGLPYRVFSCFESKNRRLEFGCTRRRVAEARAKMIAKRKHIRRESWRRMEASKNACYYNHRSVVADRTTKVLIIDANGITISVYPVL